METQPSSHDTIRVLFVVESFSTGVYAIVRDITCNLNPNTFEVLILHSLRDDSPQSFVDDFTYQHIHLQHIPMGSKKDYVPAIRKIKQVIREFNPQSIHLHSSKAGVLGRIAAKHTACQRILYSPHGFSFLRTDVSSFARWIFLCIERVINWYNPAKIIAVSEGEKVEAKKITSNCVVINNFIDTTQFDILSSESKYDVVTTGRIAPQKNPILFNTIAESLPSVSFLWVGNGPLRSTLSSPNITITGYVPRQEAIGHVIHAKIYLQTSLWEGMPVSILEAMAAGKPIVASNIIGNKDLLVHNKTGILCNPQNTQEFVDAVKNLLEDKHASLSLGTEACAYAHAVHDISIAIARYSAEYAGTTD